MYVQTDYSNKSRQLQAICMELYTLQLINGSLTARTDPTAPQ